MILSGHRHGEIKSSTMAKLRIHPDTSAMPFHDFFAKRQADARSRILGGGMQTLENDEDPVGILGIDSNAVIANRKQPFVLPLYRRNVNARGPVTVELDRVADKVLKQLGKLSAVGHNHRQ